MAIREPVAFMSYVRSDDAHDYGRITALRERLEGEVKMQTGRPFAIFQDRNDISWGQQWEKAIHDSLQSVVFLIPVLTPSFFESGSCRSEFNAFLLREKTLGTSRLILPLHYVNCDQLLPETKSKDEIAETLLKRNWNDWRKFRFTPFSDPEMARAIADMASGIKSSVAELETIFAASEGTSIAHRAVTTLPARPSVIPGAHFSPDIQVARAERGKVDPQRLKDLRARAGYYAYTKQFDEEVRADTFVEQSEIIALYKKMSSQASQLNRKHSKSAVMRPSKRVEPGRLAVTILVDNSGSMRGQPISGVAAWCGIISQWLETAGIAHEVLGFTTRAWKGGQSRERWLADGKPEGPGRLNDLRHIIYKSFAEDAGTARPNLSIMLREGLLKENIDGEAVLWACKRLSAFSAQRKLLFVISDGAPMDDSTLAENAGNFLERHLRDVVGWVSSQPHIEIMGIGFAHDPGKYYPVSVKAKDISVLGLPILDVLAKAL
jgi:cobaltochelatase CobT